ncbi:hypothetical protein FCM35_KLT00709 [Carex littledalei]|uniref:Uncharacterized protein n=1 Tax=Carex littledalei TaxID=544730 RepID=A0A833VLT6_9POAL|nr:hypothetical protein FCM35_KLT00709 [Carex littledalei]
MSSREDLLHSDKNETDETSDPIATRHVSETKPRDLVQLKISRGSSSKQNPSTNPTKISISTIPHHEFDEFESSFSGKPFNNGEDGVFVITLAGENLGANMAIKNAVNAPPATPNVNNNVQSINNSTIQESSCVTRDPGVHLEIVSSRKDLDLVDYVQRKEPNLKGQLNLNQERRPENEPRVRRRCLRSLFMESDSDIEDAGKPRRHGCRYKCEDKKEKKGEKNGGDGGASTSSKVQDK